MKNRVCININDEQVKKLTATQNSALSMRDLPLGGQNSLMLG